MVSFLLVSKGNNFEITVLYSADACGHVISWPTADSAPETAVDISLELTDLLLTFGLSLSVVIMEMCHLDPLQENLLQGAQMSDRFKLLPLSLQS